jgi:hypothetical protein
MNPILPFRLKVPGIDEVRDFEAVSISYRFTGRAALEGDELHLEWRGEAQVEEVGLLNVEDKKVSLPHESLVVPVHDLMRATLAGGWWRPRVTLHARNLGLLSIVPGEEGGVLNLWYARRDGLAAKQLVDALNSAMTQPRFPLATTPPEGV